jgi:hypothetical protein
MAVAVHLLSQRRKRCARILRKKQHLVAVELCTVLNRIESGVQICWVSNLACSRRTMKRSSGWEFSPYQERPEKQARLAVEASQLLSPSPTTAPSPVSEISESNNTDDVVSNDATTHGPDNSRDVVCFGMVLQLSICCCWKGC